MNENPTLVKDFSHAQRYYHNVKRETGKATWN